MVLLADSESKLQSMLNHVAQWCNKWRIIVLDLKNGIVHFRNTSSKKSEVVFTLGGSIIETVPIINT